MSLADTLGCAVEPQSGFRRRFVELAVREPLSTIIAAATTPLDRAANRISSGRWTVTSIIAGFPVLWLTTIGASTSLPRTVPLLGIPTPRRNLAVLGTGFGKVNTPAWVHNLLAHPDVTAEWRGEAVQVTAIPLSPEEQEPVWNRAIEAYPNYSNYRQEAAHREIRIFELVLRT